MRGRALAAAALFVAGSLALGATLGDYGPASDEPNYIHGADLEAQWLAGWLGDGQVEGRSAFDPEILARYWDPNPLRIPHPPLSRELAALSAWLAPEGTHPLVAHRLHLAVLGGALLAIAFLWVHSWIGRGAAWAVALAMVAMPQLVGHAHVGLTDFPLAVWWFAAVAATAALPGPPVRRGIVAGLCIGAALATKLPAVFLLPVLVGWILWKRRREGLREIGAMLLVAAALVLLLNPNGWVDPAAKLERWLHLSTTRKNFHPIRSFYFGTTYSYHPPWHYPWVHLVATAPLGAFLLAVIGTVSGLRGGPQSRDRTLLLLASAGVLPAVLSWPSSPCHDGVRLFLPTLPLVAVLASAGLAHTALWFADRLRSRRWAAAVSRLEPKVFAMLGLLGLGPGLIATLATHPDSMAYYGAAVGGVRGADRLGLETTYLKEVMTPDFIRELNRRIPPRSRILTGFTYEELAFDQQTGDLDASFRLTDFLPAEFYVMVHRKGELSDEDWEIRRTVAPLAQRSLDGVPLVSLYGVAAQPSPGAGSD